MTWVCESKHHVGDRLVPHPSDRIELRLEARRVSDQGRERVKILEHICKTCMGIVFALETAGEQQEMFG